MQIQLSLAGARRGRAPARSRSTPAPTARRTAEWTRHATGALGPAEAAAARRSSSSSLAAAGRRAGRGRASTTGSPSSASTTAPPSRACAPPGAAARRSSPRSPCPRSAAGGGRFGIHPALLDAALHAAALVSTPATAEVRLPSPGAACARRAGATSLRVRLAALDGRVGLAAAIEDGAPALSVELVGPPGSRISPLQRGPLPPGLARLARVDPAADALPKRLRRPIALLGAGHSAAGIEAELYPDLEPSARRSSRGRRSPSWSWRGPSRRRRRARRGRPPRRRRRALARPGLARRRPPGGLPPGRSHPRRGRRPRGRGTPTSPRRRSGGWSARAQSEHPGRFVLVDLDGTRGLAGGARAAALRSRTSRSSRCARARCCVPRAGRAVRAPMRWRPPAGPAWRLRPPERGTLEAWRSSRAPTPSAPLGPGQVRVAVRAAGLNFRDVLIALGMYPGDGAASAARAPAWSSRSAPDVTELAPATG